jgi:hypothetical protein
MCAVPRLRFLGGPWDNRAVQSEVSTAPWRLQPDPDEQGAYLRVESDVDTDTTTYIWNPDADATS